MSYFIGKSHFEEDGTQNYLLFQPIVYNYLVFHTSANSLNPTLSYYDTKIRVKFTRGCLEQPKISYTYGKVVSIYIVYELGASSSNLMILHYKIVYLVQLL